ncbi:MAG TPA: PilZ domain-containing protein [Xanthobacteraceae bacterium]|nr:PilZ domain-containing protein [Xanthobacteraceae bacterium]
MSGIPQDDESADRRTVTRTKVLRNAKIIVPARSSIVHCTVQNITSGGACLKLANTYGMPDSFELTFEHGRTRRACRVIWRTADQLGIAFEGDDVATVEEPRAGFPVKVPPPRE